MIATNATLTKTEATRVSEMARRWLARAIAPIHTPVDGDLIFTLATQARAASGDAGVIGALAAEVMADAILRAARQRPESRAFHALRDLPRP